MARWPFLAPRAAEEGLRDEEEEAEEEVGFRCFLGMPCAILFCFVAGGSGIRDRGRRMRVEDGGCEVFRRMDVNLCVVCASVV